MQLIRAAYDALPEGGAYIVIESIIDDARRQNAFGLLMSLNMLIEFGDAFDYTARRLQGLVHRGRIPRVRGDPADRARERRRRLQVGRTRPALVLGFAGGGVAAYPPSSRAMPDSIWASIAWVKTATTASSASGRTREASSTISPSRSGGEPAAANSSQICSRQTPSK